MDLFLRWGAHQLKLIVCHQVQMICDRVLLVFTVLLLFVLLLKYLVLIPVLAGTRHESGLTLDNIAHIIIIFIHQRMTAIKRRNTHMHALIQTTTHSYIHALLACYQIFRLFSAKMMFVKISVVLTFVSLLSNVSRLFVI